MMEREGFLKRCPRCNGTGKEKKSEGIFTVVEKEIECKMCKGAKAIFFETDCPLMSGGQLESGAGTTGSTIRIIPIRCSGDKCTIWDRENGGGCLWRKSLAKR